jgi:hypothetical protein
MKPVCHNLNARKIATLKAKIGVGERKVQVVQLEQLLLKVSPNRLPSV